MLERSLIRPADVEMLQSIVKDLNTQEFFQIEKPQIHNRWEKDKEPKDAVKILN